jgi:hypothetical protein
MDLELATGKLDMGDLPRWAAVVDRAEAAGAQTRTDTLSGW